MTNYKFMVSGNTNIISYWNKYLYTLYTNTYINKSFYLTIKILLDIHLFKNDLKFNTIYIIYIIWFSYKKIIKYYPYRNHNHVIYYTYTNVMYK